MRWTRADPGEPADVVELAREGDDWVVRQGTEVARFTGPPGVTLALIWRRDLIDRAGWRDYEEEGDVEFC